MKPWIRWVFIPGALATLATCALVEGTCACTRVAPAVIVAGQAVDSTGVELGGVRVGLQVRDPTCATDLTPPLSVLTDSVGEFVLYRDGIAEGTDVCAEVEGLRFSVSAVDTVRISGIPLTAGFGEAHDVDLVFPHRPGP
ncbi:MAG: hypothetical protein HKN73_20410 [Gemmatimonadetes bacterium]|nr:hypothetical protein [Gemmatimonadota bacterium]